MEVLPRASIYKPESHFPTMMGRTKRVIGISMPPSIKIALRNVLRVVSRKILKTL